jgi:hypothetical protein
MAALRRQRLKTTNNKHKYDGMCILVIYLFEAKERINFNTLLFTRYGKTKRKEFLYNFVPQKNGIS